jgi:hypothetical protein
VAPVGAVVVDKELEEIAGKWCRILSLFLARTPGTGVSSGSAWALGNRAADDAEVKTKSPGVVGCDAERAGRFVIGAENG